MPATLLSFTRVHAGVDLNHWRCVVPMLRMSDQQKQDLVLARNRFLTKVEGLLKVGRVWGACSCACRRFPS